MNRMVLPIIVAYVLAPAQTLPGNSQSPFGVNLSGVKYHSTQLAFVDMMRRARPWLKPGNWGADLPASDLTATGYPRGGVEAMTMVVGGSIDGQYPQGRYLFVYEGEATFDFSGVSVVEQSPGRMVLERTGQNIYFILRNHSTTNPVTSMKMIMPGYWENDEYENSLFYGPFKERLKPFKVLRFMDWGETNHSPQKHWNERTTPEHFTYSGHHGVPVEMMVDLANELNADAWFCMPHQATDDFVRQFALLVRDRLKPHLRAYVEHSNEIWNSIFEQTHYANQKGVELRLDSDEWKAGQLYHSMRSVQIFRIWEDVFGGTERLVRVLATHQSSTSRGRMVTGFQDAYKDADAVAIAPYFGSTVKSAGSVDAVLKAAEEDMNTRIRENIAGYAALAEERGLKLIAYEGGQHLAQHRDDNLTKLFIEANRDPRMGQLYHKYYDMWKELGGEMFVAFSFCGMPNEWGSWGMLETIEQPVDQAPKYKATIDWMRNNPRWWEVPALGASAGHGVHPSLVRRGVVTLVQLGGWASAASAHAAPVFDMRGRLLAPAELNRTAPGVMTRWVR